MIRPETLDLTASDVGGTKRFRARAIAPEATVGELVETLVPRMHLPRTDASQRPLNYHARLEREGRHLHASERIGEALRTGDEISLHPNVDAGGVMARAW